MFQQLYFLNCLYNIFNSFLFPNYFDLLGNRFPTMLFERAGSVNQLLFLLIQNLYSSPAYDLMRYIMDGRLGFAAIHIFQEFSGRFLALVEIRHPDR